MKYEWSAVAMWALYAVAIGQFIYVYRTGELATTSTWMLGLMAVGFVMATAVVIHTFVQERRRIRGGTADA